MEKIVKIVNSTSTEQVIEEMILNEIELREQKQQEHDLQFRDIFNADGHANL